MSGIISNNQNKQKSVIYKSTDLGNTGVIVFQDDNFVVNNQVGAIQRLFFVNDNLRYAIGLQGIFFKTPNGGISWQTLSLGLLNPDLKDIWFVPSSWLIWIIPYN